MPTVGVDDFVEARGEHFLQDQIAREAVIQRLSWMANDGHEANPVSRAGDELPSSAVREMGRVDGAGR